MRVLVADDHDLVRDTLSAYLQADGFEVKTAPNLQEALKIVEQSPLFDVILLDYAMPGMNGLEGMKKMMSASSDRPVAIISGTATKSVADDALKQGAKGFIPKTMAAKSLVNAVRFIGAGEIYIPTSFLKEEEAGSSSVDLTQRELQVLRGICEGKSNKEIAIDYDLQEVTVKLHVKTLSRKLGAKNRTHAAMIARDLQLL